MTKEGREEVPLPQLQLRGTLCTDATEPSVAAIIPGSATLSEFRDLFLSRSRFRDPCVVGDWVFEKSRVPCRSVGAPTMSSPNPGSLDNCGTVSLEKTLRFSYDKKNSKVLAQGHP